jgi:methionine-rich copper-binding protein CopC
MSITDRLTRRRRSGVRVAPSDRLTAARGIVPGRLAAAAAGMALLGVLATAAPAQAHTTLTGSDPGKGTTVTTSPAQIRLTFADPVRFPGVVLTDAKGGHHESGKPSAVDNHVVEQVAGVLPPGVYTVGWRVVAEDGHPVTGKFTFTMKGGTSSTSPTSSAPSSAPSNSPAGQNVTTPTKNSSAGWWWIGLAILIVALVAGGVTLLRRRRT